MDNRSWKYLLASLFIHSLVVLLIQWAGTKNHHEPPQAPSLQALEWIDLADEQALKGQIVDQDETGPETEEPVDTKYLGRRNQKVAEETKAQATGAFRNKPSSPSKHQATAPSAAKTVSQPLAETAPGGFFPRSRDAFREMAQRQLLSSPDSGLQSQTTDHLKEIAASSETHLNTREYVYYNYFSRIKERILQHWEPSIKKRITKLMYQGRYLASTGDRTTHLLITLNEKGQLVRVQVKSPSGLTDLDDEAIKAFEAAAPFPNPPQGLVERDGTIKLDWRFIIEA